MKWRLSSDSFPQKEISDTKSMSFTDNDKTEIITGNKFSPAKQQQQSATNNVQRQQSFKLATSVSSLAATANNSSTSAFFKPRTSNDILNELELKRKNQQQQQRNRETNDLKNSSQYDGSNNNQIFIISSNESYREAIPAETSKTATTTTTTTIAHKYIDSNAPTVVMKSNNVVNSTMIVDNNADQSKSEFHPYSNSTANPSTNGSLNHKTGSTVKLLPTTTDDQTTTQSKCSVLRNLILCICLNISYANIVRFPRELDRYGSVFLVPYFVLLILVGIPIILLEIAVGQFLGQGAVNTWRSSPLLKGACMISRFASWLCSIWISLQAVLAALYVGMLIFRSVPFTGCVHDIKAGEEALKLFADNGQDCIRKTYLTPLWDDPMYFGILVGILIIFWIITMFCTHNSKIFRRSIFSFGLIGLILLIVLTAWEVFKSLERQYFPKLWQFDENELAYSKLWFNALVQVIYSTNIGFGIMPVITGKFLYKGDAVRTSVVFICFNLLINAIAVTLFMVQYDNPITKLSMNPLSELKPLTAIYDKTVTDYSNKSNFTIEEIMLDKITACLIYVLIVITSIISLIAVIYTSSRLISRHPNYIMSLVALSASIAAFVMPEFSIPRILDSRVIGTLVITALVFDLIATIWIYGTKNIYTDLEFSIGRPISKIWLYLWCFAPVILTGILLWWCVDDDQFDVFYQYLPRWSVISFAIIIILFIAICEIFRQVDYNFFGMICEAAKPAKEWGPADPLARHAWKQWRSVCQDTGRKDFTLRRRGTRDYTHSIKKGQYSSGIKYASGTSGSGNGGTPSSNWKTSSSMTGNSSPNYSGSVFGDSAIEEDISVDKYSGVNQNFASYNNNNYNQQNYGKPNRYSSRSRKISQEKLKNPAPAVPTTTNATTGNNHKEIVYIRRHSNDRNAPGTATASSGGVTITNAANNNLTTRIEITPANESITYGIKNSMLRSNSNVSTAQNYKYNMNPSKELPGNNTGQLFKTTNNVDHICWRKFSVNSEEYSTEL